MDYCSIRSADAGILLLVGVNLSKNYGVDAGDSAVRQRIPWHIYLILEANEVTKRSRQLVVVNALIKTASDQAELIDLPDWIALYWSWLN